MTTTQLEVRSLVEKLITHETGLSPKNDPENFNICRDFALDKFKTHRFGRASQFDVQSRLAGLEEKFRILDREALAEALASRVAEIPDLSAGNLPEILTLLLELSDKPVQKTRLEDLEKCRKETPPRELTWDDIIKEEPLEGDIWKNVDFNADSDEAWSDEEVEFEAVKGRVWEGEDDLGAKRKRRRRRADDYDDEDYGDGEVERFTVEADTAGLETLKRAQYWSQKTEPREEEVDVSLGGDKLDIELWMVTELQSVREIIFMMLGYDCELYQKGNDDGPDVVWIDMSGLEKKFALRHTSHKGFVALLEWFGNRGTALNRIRTYTKTPEELPERQSFIAAIDTRLRELDKHIIAIEEKFVGAGSNEPVSLLELQSQLDPLLRPFTALADIIDDLTTSEITVSTHLEKVYSAACDLQARGDFESFRFMAQIFFDCLRTYLRPIRRWMESGLLPPTADFLITRSKSDEEVDRYSLWHSQFTLNREKAPSFIQPVAERIFTTGKSVIFLKQLHPTTTDFDDSRMQEDDLTFAQVCTNETTLAPFSAVFSLHLSRWIHTHHHSISTRLRSSLLHNCGLIPSLHALDAIFFARNGYNFELLTQSLFEKLDRKAATWSDRFLLTELIQSVYSSVPGIHPSHLRMSVIKPPGFKISRSLREARRSVNLFTQIDVDYRLPWPVANIIQPDSLLIYKQVFTFLVQVRRCRYLLERLNLLRPPTPPPPVYHQLKLQLLWFTNTVFGYLTDLVLRPQTELLRSTIEKAVDVDGMVETHNVHLIRIRDMCLLNKPLAPIHQGILGILDLAVKFTRLNTERYTATTGEEGRFFGTPLGRRRRRGSESSEDEELASPSAVSETTATSVKSGDLGGENEEEDEELGAEERYVREVEKLRGEFEGGLRFVRGGLRGVSRAGVLPHLEMLAERLEGFRVGGWGDGL